MMKDESPVFIVGAARSGTSLLYGILLRHSSFQPQQKSNQFIPRSHESHVFDYPKYAYSSKFALNYILQDKELHRQFLESIKSIREYQNFIGDFIYTSCLKKNFFRSLAYQINLSHLVLRTYFYYAKKSRLVARILEKTPSHIFRMPEMKATFPKAKYLFIYRHPVEVFSSYKRRLKMSQEEEFKSAGGKWLEASVEEFCKNYRASIDIALKEQALNPSQFLAIKYEELTANTQLAIQNICDFLGESYEEDLIVEKESKTTWKIDPLLGGKVVKQTKKWQEFISEPDAQAVEDNLSDVMTQLNYSRYTNQPALTSM
ncbi:MAG: sulfotransferase [Hydrococcus sp. Prado102]|nr:sulfotransferase [Hydrococcus sp. Prado102]